MNTRKVFSTFLIAALGGFVSLFVYTRFVQSGKPVISAEQSVPYHFAGYQGNSSAGQVDLTVAAEHCIHSVVHVKTEVTQGQTYYDPFFDFFFGNPSSDSRTQRVAGFGSGVIISADGYIVTNNHVIESADVVTVTLNDKRSFKAKIIGRDPDTDIAVIKIDATDLPYITYGNSDDLKVGEWVLAVGNPYNLTSTVTAGIVSAKARNLSLLVGNSDGRRSQAIESFIQTDAAVNPGNSGGALVNTKGELIGVNTAIASPTGAYSGNSFAVPVTIVRKIVADLVEFGTVQRGLLGVSILDINSDLAKEKNIDKIEGVYVAEVTEDGAAKAEGIQRGDVILTINNIKVNSPSELQEQISRYRPNDKVEILIKRENKEKQITVTLRNMNGTTKYASKNDVLNSLGVQLSELNNNEKRKLGLKAGVKISDIGPGKLKEEGILKGFIILRINNRSVSSADDVNQVLSLAKGVIYIEGVYPNGVVAYYTLSLDN
jgi:Do/DeqQ family serine protease